MGGKRGTANTGRTGHQVMGLHTGPLGAGRRALILGPLSAWLALLFRFAGSALVDATEYWRAVPTLGSSGGVSRTMPQAG